MNAYVEALTEAMALCATHPRAVIMGQAVAWPGTAMTQTFARVDRDKLLEMPVAEEMQLGMAIGMSLAGERPVCVYPRINFLLLAMGQLVLHLDKMEDFSRWKPKVIIRTMIASDEPMNPGPQHLGDFTHALRLLLDNVVVITLDSAGDVMKTYRRAIESDRRSYVIIERAELYAS